MASSADSDENPNQQEESIIPVLTVFKNKSVIKNICIVLNNSDGDHIILIGRHPTCNIVLTHPSISRFHLQIRFTPSSRSISLLDVSSVHGTWVSGRELERGVSVELKGGDSFRLGVSSRVYLLRFVSQFDANALKNIGSLYCDDDEIRSQFNEETFDDENDSFGTETSCCENELGTSQVCYLSPPYVQSVDEAEREPIVEACPEVEVMGETNLLCTLKECFKNTLCKPVVEADELHQQSSAAKKWIDPEASLNEKGGAAMDEIPKQSDFDGAAMDEIPKQSDFDGAFKDSDKIEDILTTVANVFNSEVMPDSESHQTNTDEEASVESLSDGEGYSLNEVVKNMDPSSSNENGVVAVNLKPREHKLEFFFEENARLDNILTSVASLFMSENKSSLVEEANPVANFQQDKIVEEVNVDSLSDGEKENKCDKELQAYKNFIPNDEEGNSLDETVEDTVKSSQTESFNPSVAQDADLDITDKENQTPQSLVAVAGCFDLDYESCVEDSAERSSTFACDKAVSELQSQTRKSRLLNTPNVDTKFVMSNLKDISVIRKAMQKDLFSVSDEEEMFTPSKENLEDSKNSNSQMSKSLLKASFSHNFYSAERSTSSFSNKENLTPIEAQQWQSERKPLECYDSAGLRKKRVERKPLQSPMQKDLFSVSDEEEMFTPSKENLEDSKNSNSQMSKSLLKASFSHNFYSAEQSTSSFSNKENLTPIEAQQWQSERKPLECHDSAGLRKKRVERTPLQSPMQKDLFSVSDEEEMFTPSKENLEDSKNSNSQMSKSLLKASFSHNFYSAERSTSSFSIKENLTPIEAQQWQSERKPLECHDSAGLRKKRVERTPLQSLMNSGDNHNSANSSPFYSPFAAKENLTPRGAQQWPERKPLECRDTAGLRKRRVERTPLQTLMSSRGNHNSANSSPFSATKETLMSSGGNHISANGSPFSAAKETLMNSGGNHISANPSPFSAAKETLMSSGGNHNLANSSPFYSPFSAAKEIPLQSLGSSGGNRNLANSSPFNNPFSAAKSILCVTARTSNSRHISDKHTEPSPISEERKRSWDMVVDAASLMNEESRKALQLLQGLKGTRLIIPESVIRELGSMKQRIGVFRRISETTLALEWIEECMGKTKWWIHILDYAFPIVEDQILDCALQYRRKDNAGQLVLLSDDVNLKIKSISEGLLCETVEQFRRSLVNPFSERFMWPNSSPRGLTWSCQDDVILREKYCCFPSKAGLKLLVT
ncbi:unnamed protein product [Lathyrus sativus]|nr:unnamed protein product [Lathyrus sativus]